MSLTPPPADPISETFVQDAAEGITIPYTLSQQLMFLQEILQEYKMTEPDWMATTVSYNLMLDVQGKIEAAEASQVIPSFNETESLWLQEILITYQHTHIDWRLRLPDFNMMLYVASQVGSNFAQPEPPSQPPQPESTNCGITPPQADPYSDPY